LERKDELTMPPKDRIHALKLLQSRINGASAPEVLPIAAVIVEHIASSDESMREEVIAQFIAAIRNPPPHGP
jgi:hypothetical protein